MKSRRLWLISLLAFSSIPLCSAQAQTLGEALDAPELTWSTAGYTRGWLPQTTETHDGVDAAEGYANYNGGSWLTTTVTGPIALSFWWYLTPESGEMSARVGNYSYSPYSAYSWEYKAIAVPAGVHTVEWVIASGFYGEDTYGYLDQVTLMPIAPDIEIQGRNSIGITNGATNTSTNDGTDYGSVFLTGAASNWTFTIRNWGTTNLDISAVEIGGLHSGDFEVVAYPGSVAANSSSNMILRFDPTAVGGRTATVTVVNNDADEGSYSFAVSGTGLPDDPVIRIHGSTGATITNGSTAVTNTLGTDFGWQYLTGVSTSRTFYVTNAGNSALNISAVNLNGANPGDFAVLSYPAMVAAGTRSNLVVRFDPTDLGPRTGSVEIESDADISPFIFSIGGTGIPDAPEIALLEGGWNWGDFGGVPAFSGVVERIWAITNPGTANLVVSSVTIQGAGAAHFSVTTYPAEIGPGAASNLAVRFSPTAAGLCTAAVVIVNNDADENPYEIHVQGRGLATHLVWTNSPTPAPPFLTWGTAAHTIQDAADICVDGDVILATNGVYDSGRAFFYETNRVEVLHAVVLQSVNGPEFTRIVGDSTMRCVLLGDDAVLSGFTITNGAAEFGGGVYGGMVSNCVIADNLASNGGGVCYADVYDSQLIGNVAAGVGGGALGGTLRRCILAGNQAGGDNYISYYFPPYNYPIYGVTGGGGASQATLYSCLVVDNRAVGGGGASFCDLYNCTVVENRAGSGGGYFGGGIVVNSIIYGNSLTNGVDDNWDCEYGFGGSEFELPPQFSFSCSHPSYYGADYITNAPGFVAGTYKLSAASPCIDSGTNVSSTLGGTDLAGNLRIHGGRVDMGAYEYTPGPDTGDYDGDGIPNDWESRFGLNPAWSNSPSMDSDHDGQPDIYEFVADTHPANGASYFPMVAVTNPPAGAMVLVVNPTSTARVYGVRWTTDLLSVPQIWTLVPPEKPGAGAAVAFTVTNDGPGRIYRTGVRLP
ncbi:MAG: choice-of-anchor D domain-containing protein [Kiritimatiellia bacterium]